MSLRTLLRRVVHLLIVLFCVTLFVSLLTSMLPGDPVDAISGFASPEQKDGCARNWVSTTRFRCSTAAGSAGS